MTDRLGTWRPAFPPEYSASEEEKLMRRRRRRDRRVVPMAMSIRDGRSCQGLIKVSNESCRATDMAAASWAPAGARSKPPRGGVRGGPAAFARPSYGPHGKWGTAWSHPPGGWGGEGENAPSAPPSTPWKRGGGNSLPPTSPAPSGGPDGNVLSSTPPAPWGGRDGSASLPVRPTPWGGRDGNTIQSPPPSLGTPRSGIVESARRSRRGGIPPGSCDPEPSLAQSQSPRDVLPAPGEPISVTSVVSIAIKRRPPAKTSVLKDNLNRAVTPKGKTKHSRKTTVRTDTG